MAKTIDTISGTKTESTADAVSSPAATPATEITAGSPGAPSPAEVATTATEATSPTPATPEPLPQATAMPSPAADAMPTPTAMPAAASTPPATPETFEALFPEPSVVFHGPPAWVWWVLLVIGAIGLGYLGFDITRGRIDRYINAESTPTASAEATTTPESTPTPETAQVTTPNTEAVTTPEPTASATAEPTASATPGSISGLTMRILNGTKVTGAAATARNTLTAAGYTIRTIGNTRNSYSNTYVYYTGERLAEAEAVKVALGRPNAIVEKSSLASPDMILVVIGAK